MRPHLTLFIWYHTVTLGIYTPSSDPEYNCSPLSVPRSALWPNAFNDQALFHSSTGLVRSALAGLCSFPWHLLEQWAHGRQPMGRRYIPNPIPVCTQLGLGTVELLNWRKIALYLGLSACAHPCPLRYMLGLNQLRNVPNKSDKMARQSCSQFQ